MEVGQILALRTTLPFWILILLDTACAAGHNIVLERSTMCLVIDIGQSAQSATALTQRDTRRKVGEAGGTSENHSCAHVLCCHSCGHSCASVTHWSGYAQLAQVPCTCTCTGVVVRLVLRSSWRTGRCVVTSQLRALCVPKLKGSDSQSLPNARGYSDSLVCRCLRLEGAL